MAKYIKCDCCGKKIMFGEYAYHYEYDSVYCSGECYASAVGYYGEVNEDFVYSCDCIVYDDEARIAEIRKEMEEHRMAMEKLFEELKSFGKYN